MTIYMVIWKYFPCTEGGAERQCRKICNELSRNGINCVVLTAHLSLSHAKNELVENGVQIFRLGRLAWFEEAGKSVTNKISRVPGLSVLKKDYVQFWFRLPFVWAARFSFMRALQRHFKHHVAPGSVVHVHEAHWIAGAVAWAGKGCDLRLVCKEATYPFKEYISYDTPLRKTLTQYRRGLHYIAINAAIQESMLTCGIPLRRISLIPNGVEVPVETAPIAWSEDVVYIANFTQGVKDKAFDVLFAAWVEIHEACPELTLNVMGAGDSSKWKKYLEQHGCRSSVRFLGSVPDVAPYLKKAITFLLPSRKEGLSNALLEAMSWGLPVVVSDIPANRDLVKNGKNGIVVPVNDSGAIAKAVCTLYRNPQLAVKLGEEARSTVEKGYSLANVVKSLTRLYSQMASV